MFGSPEYVAVIETDPADDGVYATAHVPEWSIHDVELNVCVLLLVNDTVPVGDIPLIVTDTTEELPTVIDDSVSDSDGTVCVTPMTVLPVLPWLLFESPEYVAAMVCEPVPTDDGV